MKCLICGQKLVRRVVRQALVKISEKKYFLAIDDAYVCCNDLNLVYGTASGKYMGDEEYDKFKRERDNEKTQ